MMDVALNEFADSENITHAEFMMRLRSASEDRHASKSVTLLLNGSDYNKFCQMMLKKSKEMYKDEDNGADVSAVADGKSSSPVVKRSAWEENTTKGF